jgi:hypothetical protein
MKRWERVRLDGRDFRSPGPRGGLAIRVEGVVSRPLSGKVYYVALRVSLQSFLAEREDL